MTREEAIKVLIDEWKCIDRNDGINCDRKCESCDLVMDSFVLKEAYNLAIKALSQEPCDDAISRQDAIDAIYEHEFSNWCDKDEVSTILNDLPSVTQKSGKCKNCKYFEYDSVAKVDGIPLIVAHEICNKWGNGCKTSEDGYCYLFEPQESEEQTE